MLPSIKICPATCELCGQWMPGHSKDCPRSGVHPSQWSLYYTDMDETISTTTETFIMEEFDLFDDGDSTSEQQQQLRHDIDYH